MQLLVELQWNEDGWVVVLKDLSSGEQVISRKFACMTEAFHHSFKMKNKYRPTDRAAA